MRMTLQMVSVLALSLLVAIPASAQDMSSSSGSEILPPDALGSTLAAHESAPDRARAKLDRILSHESVRSAADERGIDMDRVESAASTLSDEEVSRLAPVLEDLSEALVQNGSITISVTAIIIILLLLILLT